MTDHKRQHFVPQFYLRRFSQDGKSINVFNIKSKRSILKAPIKGQCYRDNFYGKDRVVEKALSQLEAEMSRVLKSVQSQGALPKRPLHDLNTFFSYVLFQHSRTEQFIGAYESQIEGVVKRLVNPTMEAKGYSPEELAKVRVGLKEGPRFMLKQTAKLLPLFFDLNCKLVRITSAQEFVTSDSPVVFYNQLLSFQKTGGAGIASKGLQVFFPLDPKHLAILYDKDVYRVGPPHSHLIEISNNDDVRELNRLQFVHALHNVYFSADAYSAVEAYYECRKYRTSMQFNSNTHLVKKTEEGHQEILAISQYRARTNLNLSFVRLLGPAKKWSRDFQKLRMRPLHGAVRNQQVIAEHKIFINLVEQGRYQISEFGKYLREKYQDGVLK